MSEQKVKQIKARDWHAVNAWNHHRIHISDNKRKQKSKDACRKWKYKYDDG